MSKKEYTVKVIKTDNVVDDPNIISRLFFGMSLDELADEIYDSLVAEEDKKIVRQKNFTKS